MSTLASLFTAFAGLACLSLAMPRHWAQARGGNDPGRAGLLLRLAGIVLMVVSLWARLARSPATGIAVVDWLGLLTLAGLAAALLLTYAPRRLPLLAVAVGLAAGVTGFT